MESAYHTSIPTLWVEMVILPNFEKTPDLVYTKVTPMEGDPVILKTWRQEELMAELVRLFGPDYRKRIRQMEFAKPIISLVRITEMNGTVSNILVKNVREDVPKYLQRVYGNGWLDQIRTIRSVHVVEKVDGTREEKHAEIYKNPVHQNFQSMLRQRKILQSVFPTRQSATTRRQQILGEFFRTVPSNYRGNLEESFRVIPTDGGFKLEWLDPNIRHFLSWFRTGKYTQQKYQAPPSLDDILQKYKSECTALTQQQQTKIRSLVQIRPSQDGTYTWATRE